MHGLSYALELNILVVLTKCNSTTDLLENVTILPYFAPVPQFLFFLL
jgi:hypothetical protein